MKGSNRSHDMIRSAFYVERGKEGEGEETPRGGGKVKSHAEI